MIKVLVFGILMIVSTSYVATTLVTDTVTLVIKAKNESRLIAAIE